MNIYEKIKNCETMPQLDEIRIEVMQAMRKGDEEDIFYSIQKAFIKQRNKLKRIPLKDRQN
jgi:hypothetical protein